jgi:hypothetical protein
LGYEGCGDLVEVEVEGRRSHVVPKARVAIEATKR